ncbi:hypothetical protein A3765_13900 [Oleiphilus sp. HI0130]|nr:hypothetical protein A3765_13900 [Oleiphilus sp. HI0130]
MPDTLREQIVEAFTTKIGAARCARLDGDSDLPAKSVWDNAEEAERTKYSTFACSMDIPVEYMAKIDTVTYSNFSKQANAMLGELIALATSGDPSLGDLCKSIQYSAAEFIYPDDGSREIEVFAVFRINYEFVAGDPFAAA